VDPRAVIRLIQHPDRDYRLEGALKLRISRETEEGAERFEFAEKLMADLRGPPAGGGAPLPDARTQPPKTRAR
jgi:hypothetical protein